MNYRILDNCIPDSVGNYLFTELIRSNIFSLSLQSTIESTSEEVKLPGSLLYDMGDYTFSHGREFGKQLALAFHWIMTTHGLYYTKLERILCNANYPNSPLWYHTDHSEPNYETLVLFLTPDYHDSGIMIGDEYVGYEFCRSVIFPSNVSHTAVTSVRESINPRISVGFMYGV